MAEQRQSIAILEAAPEALRRMGPGATWDPRLELVRKCRTINEDEWHPPGTPAPSRILWKREMA